MTWIQLLACSGMIVGIFLLLNLKPMEFADSLFGFLTKDGNSLKAEIAKANQNKKHHFLKREILEAQEILTMTGRSNHFSLICAASLMLFAAGASFAILLGNVFLAPVMAVGFMLMPFWYVKLTANHFKRDLASELETALSVITTAYLRSEDILTAVEENVTYLNPPVRMVFADFLMRIQLVDPDVEAALKAMRGRIDNDVFREWVDALKTTTG